MAVSTRLTPREGRKFAFTVGIAFLVFGTISAWRGHVWPPRALWTLGTVLLLAGLVIPGMLGPVYRGWMAIGTTMSKVTAPVFVALSYYVILTPFGLVMRAVGRNPLRRTETNGGFWVPVRRSEGSDLEDQF